MQEHDKRKTKESYDRKEITSCQEETERDLQEEAAADKAVVAPDPAAWVEPEWPVRPVSACALSAATRRPMNGVHPVLNGNVQSVEQR